uniref:Uncharacterized protein n=1 Tax=viral metagenome TaxID=1070528 RepID=A0A6M3M7B6_9ZZZZ
MKKKKKCPNCGREFEGKRKYCCYGCSVTATVEANKQLKDKEGPIYEKWKTNLEASLNKLFRS